MWDFYIAKTDNDNQNRHDKTQVQKEEVVYSHDINHNIVRAENYLQTWESLNLNQDQKLYKLIFNYSVLSQLILHIKKLKEAADQSAVKHCEEWLEGKERREKKKEVM